MPQIAQQDYIYVEIADLAHLTDSEKAELRKHMAAGSLFDVIIINKVNYYVRIIAYDKDANTITVYDYDNSEFNEYGISE